MVKNYRLTNKIKSKKVKFFLLYMYLYGKYFKNTNHITGVIKINRNITSLIIKKIIKENVKIYLIDK